MLAETVVHTTGVNWMSVLTIIGGVVAIMSTIITAVALFISGKITAAINLFRIQVVNQLDLRLTKVEQTVTDIKEDVTEVRIKQNQYRETKN